MNTAMSHVETHNIVVFFDRKSHRAKELFRAAWGSMEMNRLMNVTHVYQLGFKESLGRYINYLM